MPTPQQEIRFVLHEVLAFEGHYQRLGLEDLATGALLDAVLEEGARFADNELEPCNRAGDEHGCAFDDGRVTTPPGFKEAYAKYRELGWAGICGDPAFGGQGLPHSVGLLLEELTCRANMAWTMYPGLSRSAIAALQSHGDEEVKARFLGHLLSGTWTGTMCLTEPQAGSDVGLLRTRAEPHADGSYRISGTKIFISAGEHDMAENILHLVLARLPDAPAGTKGITLFAVPKLMESGDANGVKCGGIEEKMGIHGSATCVMHFEDARGYRIGEENRGMHCMFTMMNAARIGVGLQGVCVAQAAMEAANAYALERLQMRSLSGPKAPDKPADPIVVHPDVRRMLLTQKAIVEGGRTLIYYCGQLLDESTHGADAAARDKADTLLDFLTPIVKGCLTELGFESVNHAMQVFGGHGFIRETGVEQFVRDARITLIYEGTTQIQGLDLLGRKIVATQGAGLMQFIGMMNELADALPEGAEDRAATLRALASEWGELTLAIGGRAQADPEELGAASVDYLMYSGYCVLAYFWAKMAEAARARGTEDPLAAGKVAVAEFFFKRLLPRTQAHKAAIEAGADSLMAPPESVFAS